MRIRALVHEDFVNYKKPSMFIGTATCDWKCCHDGGFPVTVCQNNELAEQPIVDVPDKDIIKLYMDNEMTHSIVIGGLEPFKQYNELLSFIKCLRNDFGVSDDVVIYTGYKENEIADMVNDIASFGNIVVKYGRYDPVNHPDKRFDEVLGVYLVTSNQYARRYECTTKKKLMSLLQTD